MGTHAFVDESSNGSYLICAALIDACSLAGARKDLRSFCKPGQHRVHMAKESDRRRREALSLVAGLRVDVGWSQTPRTGEPQRHVRDAALTKMSERLQSTGVSRLVIESCDQDKADRIAVRQGIDLSAAPIAYLHDRPHAEPLLWIPDILAWAYNKGGNWRRRVDGATASLVRLTP